jgi:hypothetical protein
VAWTDIRQAVTIIRGENRIYAQLHLKRRRMLGLISLGINLCEEKLSRDTKTMIAYGWKTHRH